MLLKKNITSMSDLSDYSPKSLCRVSETIESSNLDDIVKKIKKEEIINSCLYPSHVRKSPNKKII